MNKYLYVIAAAVLLLLSGQREPTSVWAIAPEPQQAQAEPRMGGTLPNPNCNQIPFSECAALYTLYAATNGAGWLQNEGWLAGPKPCDWYGVSCRADADGILHVYSLSLSWNQLQGAVPAELVNLTALHLLDLSGNELSGPLPASLGTLSELAILDLAENQLAGEVPEELSTLTNLSVLHLYGNGFAGNLPLDFTQLTQLRNFRFQNTQICVPNDQALEAWLDNIDFLSRPAAADCRPIDQTPKPLVLIYAVLDNNLNSEWERLVNNAEKGVRSGAFDVKLLIDAAGADNSFEYTLQEDYNDSCPSLVINDPDCNRYQLRQTLLEQVESTAQRDTLVNFLTTALLEHPHASHVVLALVGHGSGWGANGLPSQPKGWSEQGEPVIDMQGGMLWDDTPGDGSTQTTSLSTRALGSALRQVKATTGKSIDLLYLDACSMAMVEVAYEVRESVDYLLASENTKWATFPYDRLLPLVGTMIDGRSLGQQWLQMEMAVLDDSPGHPYTFSLIDSAAVGAVMTATTNLVAALDPLLATNHLQIRQAFSQTSHFDSNYDGAVDGLDAYVDLADFAHQLTRHFADDAAVVTAAQALQTAVSDAVVSNGYDDSSVNGASPAAASWPALGGLSIYLPLANPELRQSTLYNAANLAWADQGTWDEFLTEYWLVVADAPTATAIEQCPQTADCPNLTGWGFLEQEAVHQVYLPIIQGKP